MEDKSWTCPGCTEAHVDVFEACWKCGADRPQTDLAGPFRGSLSGETELAGEEPGANVEDVSQDSLEDQLLARFECGKCESTRGRTRRIATTGTGLSKIIDLQRNHFVALSCQSCGFTELFDPTVLEGKSSVSSVLDFFFG